MLPESHRWILEQFEPEGDPWLLFGIANDLEKGHFSLIPTKGKGGRGPINAVAALAGQPPVARPGPAPPVAVAVAGSG